MSLVAPGTIGWLLRHELRISWRYMIGLSGGKTRSLYIGFGILVAFALLIGAPVGFFSRALDIDPLPAAAVVVIDLALAFIATLMLAQTIGAATLVFHDRGDLDLLLSSPVRPARLLMVRKLAMAFNAMISFLILLAPFIITAALLGGHWGWLTALPVLVALGLFATSLGVAGAFGMFRVLGPRRTRTVAQILGAVIGASIFLLSQSHLILGKTQSRGFWRDTAASLEGVQTPALAQWPARAATGDLLAFAVLMLVLMAVFVLASRSLGARFAANAALVAGAAEPSRKAVAARPPRPFRSGLMRVMVGKELKLLARDPALISQVLLQVIYLVPVSFIIMRSSQGDSDVLTLWTLASGAGVTTFLAGQIAAGLGWLTMSAEEAPEMLTAAPVSPQRVGLAKVIAAVIPVAVLLLLPALAIGRAAPWVGLCILAGGIGCAVAIAYVEQWTQKPGKRSNFRMRRKGSGAIWVALLELLLCGLFGLVTTLTAAQNLFAVIPAILLVAVIVPLKKDRWLNRDG